MADSDKLMSLNKDLLTRNAELVKRLKKMKSERDDFESQSNSWKQIYHDASQALALQQRNNAALSQRLDEYQRENRSLHSQLRSMSNEHHHDGHSLSHFNTLKFNYEQKKNEIEMILHQIHKLFAFCDANYPQITHGLTESVDPHHQQPPDEVVEDDGFDDDLSNFDPHSTDQRNDVPVAVHNGYRPKRNKKGKKTRDFMVTRNGAHRSSQSASDLDVYRRRRSLPMVLTSNQIGNGLVDPMSPHSEEDADAERDFMGNNKSGKRDRDRGHSIVVEEAISKRDHNERNGGGHGHGHGHRDRDGVVGQIEPRLLGPSTRHETHPFQVAQSSHSFFSEHHQRSRYNAVRLNMSGTKLWSKRDSLPGRKKTPRINAIPSSAGSTPLTTPQQSRRGRVSDDDHDDERDFDEDPHTKYLEMMHQGQPQDHGVGGNGTEFVSGDLVSAPTDSGPTASNGSGQRIKMTDKGAIHDLFDLLQKETLNPSSPAALHQMETDDHRNGMDLEVGQSEDVHLVSLLEVDHSPSSDSDSSSD